MLTLCNDTLRALGLAPASDSPERILQFGEGNFLRAFADSFVDIANETTGFDARIVVVTPRSGRNVPKFRRQDCLYTLLLRGYENGNPVHSARIIRSISRCLSSADEFDAVLECAANPNLRWIISNTTEAGIVFQDTDRFTSPENASFPGKLTRFLYERFTRLGKESAPGFVFLPCELIEHNGEALYESVQRYADLWNLGEAFSKWLRDKNEFCSTLVDRIVPGYPEDAEEFERSSGYRDELLVAGEPFAFWAIEGRDSLNDELPFARAGLPVLVAPDITFYKRRKVCILNGAHTSMTCAALLCGLETVGQCMEDADLSRFLQRAIYDEIIPASDLPADALSEFAGSVADRFRNPHIRHALKSITLNTTSKWRARILPTVCGYVSRFGKVPPLLTFGFAANIAYQLDNLASVSDDDAVLKFYAIHAEDAPEALIDALCSEESFWGMDLHSLPGFAAAAAACLTAIRREGARSALGQILSGEENA